MSFRNVTCAAMMLLGSILAVPSAVHILFSDADCKANTRLQRIPGTNNTATICTGTCDDEGVSCENRSSPTGQYPVSVYCSCSAVGDPTNSPICHAFFQQEVPNGMFLKKCTKGNCGEGKKCDWKTADQEQCECK